MVASASTRTTGSPTARSLIVLLVPGGQGTRKEMHNPALIDWIRQASTKAELVLSVCTGALLLAKAGLLDGLEATTHHGAIDLLRQTAPKTTVHADRRFVDNGRVVCSAGIAAGIDMSLHVVSRLLGKEVAEQDGPADGVPLGAAFMTIRPEDFADHEAIRHVNRLAFGQDDEARLVDALRDGGFVRMSLVAERAGRVVGHILFSDLPIITGDGTVAALALAPMAVLPELQRQGIGSALVQMGLEACRQQGHRIVVVLGHAHFYPTVRVLPEAGCEPGVAVFGQRLLHGAGVGAWGAGRRCGPGAVPAAVWSLGVMCRLALEGVSVVSFHRLNVTVVDGHLRSV